MRRFSTTMATFVYVTHEPLEAMALSTSICLMNTAVLQQYAPPLTLYGEPVNQFVAEFVGNPEINFIDFDLQRNGDHLTLTREGVTLGLEPKDMAALAETGDNSRVGNRPANVHICEHGDVPGTVVSAFPYGMETTVVTQCMGMGLRSVVFGSIDFVAGQAVEIRLDGVKAILFHPETGKMLSLATLKMPKA